MLGNAVPQDVSCELLIKNRQVLWKGSQKLDFPFLRRLKSNVLLVFKITAPKRIEHWAWKRPLAASPPVPASSAGGEEAGAGDWLTEPISFPPPLVHRTANARLPATAQNQGAGKGREIKNAKGTMQHKQKKDLDTNSEAGLPGGGQWQSKMRSECVEHASGESCKKCQSTRNCLPGNGRERGQCLTCADSKHTAEIREKEKVDVLYFQRKDTWDLHR